jgi:hypothetical protein
MSATSSPIVVSRSQFIVEVIGDYNPDLSFLGEYKSQRPTSEWFIDRQKRGDMGRNECRYFVVGCGDPDNMEEDYKRMEEYNRGDWHMTIVRASIVLELPASNLNCRISHKVTSPGLGGIESDSNPEYVKSVFHDECDTLASMLEALGVVVVD